MNDFAESGGLGALVWLIFAAAAFHCLARATSIRARNIAENQKYMSKESDRYSWISSTIMGIGNLFGAMVSFLTGSDEIRVLFVTFFVVSGVLFLGIGVYCHNRPPAKNRLYKPDQTPLSAGFIKTQSSQPTVRCLQCGSAYPSDARFCPICGTMLDSSQGGKLCPICGAQGAPGQLFCENCGTVL